MPIEVKCDEKKTVSMEVTGREAIAFDIFEADGLIEMIEKFGEHTPLCFSIRSRTVMLAALRAYISGSYLNLLETPPNA